MKIVVLNECFLQPNHLERLAKLGELETYTDTNTAELAIERLHGADIAISDCFVTPMNAQFFSNIPSVKCISINTIGYDAVDLEAAKKASIKISNIPGYCAQSVAEQTFALIFATVRNIVPFNRMVQSGVFEIDPADKTKLPYLGFEIAGKTLGIVGLGDIGARVAQMAHGLGMNVVAYSRSSRTVPHVKNVSLEELLQTSDIVSLHTPLNAESENLIGEKELELMKPTSVLINTARGKIIDETALISALQTKRIAAAGLDIVRDTNRSNPLLKMENVVVSPHCAWYTKEAFYNLAEMVTSNVEAFAQGTPENLIP